MKRVAFWLTPLIALGVAVFIVIFMVQINRTEKMPFVEPVPLNGDKNTKSALSEKRWLDTLAKSERHGYFYPVNEIYVEVDLNQKLINEKIYQLSAWLRDPYQLFCLKQELKQHGLRYSLKKEETGAELLVYSKDQAKMKALVNALKNYEITATVLPYKEDQRWKTIK